MKLDEVRPSLNSLNLYGRIVGRENGILFRPGIEQDPAHELMKR